MVDDVLPPTTPATFKPRAPAQNVKPFLSWAGSTDTGGASLDRYDVYRNGVLAGSSGTPGFQDGAVTIEGTYTYTVIAVDKAGNEANPTPQRSVQYDSSAST